MGHKGLRWRGLLFATLAMMAAGGALAQTKQLGFDDNSCQAWVRSKESPEQRREYVSWVRGTVEQFLERFCRDTPKADFTEAAYRMSDNYSGRSAPISR
jgi:hypothetical protein